MLDIISFDFDSTISNSRHRWDMIDRENGTDWEAYSMQSEFDDNGPALPIAQWMSKRREPFIIVSGRSECARRVSMKWLRDREVYPWAVFMCDSRHDYMEHGEWKAMRFKEIQKENNWNIVMHFDDIKDVAVSVRDDPDLDFPVILVHTIESENISDHLG